MEVFKNFAFVILFALAIQSSAQEQDRTLLIEKAEKAYDKKDYRNSVKLYESAFKLSGGSVGELYNAACSAALAGKSEQAMNWLLESVEKGWANPSHMQSDTDLTSIRNLPKWNLAIEKAQENQKEYESRLNLPLKQQLESIYIKDQTLRQLIEPAMEKFGKDSKSMQYLWSLMSEQDSLNELEVLAILEKQGWPGRSEVGGQANMTVWLVIQHADLEIQEKYLPMMRESVEKGQSSGSHLALLEDRILMRQGKPQVYGSQVITDEVTGKEKVYEVMEPEYVDQRRKSVGLGPLADYLSQWNIVWDIPQKER